MITIDQADLNIIIDSLEKNFDICQNVAGYYKRSRIEVLLGKLYNYQNNYVLIDPLPAKATIKVKKYNRKYQLK